MSVGLRRGCAAIGLLALAACAGAERAGWPVPQECLAEEDPWARRVCLEPHLRALAGESSPREAVCEAAALQEDGTIDDCHLLAHAIGEESLEIFGGDAGRALAACGEGCIDGCLHGVMQAFIVSLPSEVGALADAVHPLCDQTEGDLRYACVHGVGHGVRGHGVLGLLDALAVCETHPDGEWAWICTGGVLMEQVDMVLPLRLEGLGQVLPEICAELEGDPLLEHCVAAIGEGLMFRTGHDLAASEELCLRLADGAMIEQCVHGARTEAEVVARGAGGC